MKYYLKINNFIMCILVVFLLSACTHKAMEDTKLNDTEVQKHNTVQEVSADSLNYKITQEIMDKLYANMPYDEMVETVGCEPILFLEDEINNTRVYHYNISGEKFEENNCTLDLTFRNKLLDDALTGYMDFGYSEDTKIVKLDDYYSLKMGDSLKDVRKKMGNAMRFNKIFWDDLSINPKEYLAIVEGNIHVALYFSNDVLYNKHITDDINIDTLSYFQINSNVTDLSKIHPDMKVEDIQKILGSEGYTIESSNHSYVHDDYASDDDSDSDDDDNTYLWKISDTVGLEVSSGGYGLKLVGEEIKRLD